MFVSKFEKKVAKMTKRIISFIRCALCSNRCSARGLNVKHVCT